MYWSALILGFLGSMHCVIMCGPIALTLKSQNSLNRFVTSRLLYNLGRISTYSLLGVVFGLLGQGLVLATYQQFISILLGAMMLLLAIALYKRMDATGLGRPLSRLTQWFRRIFGQAMKGHQLLSSYLTGLINGFLPCGLVYAALVGALATGALTKGAWYMMIFGLGTFPAMLIVSLTGQLIAHRITPQVHKLSAGFVMLLGCILILRGMELSVPYLSPVIGFLYPLDGGITVCQ
ncbi:hypothetical protein SAMN04488028_101115 [Reichenbachiella agariperforans]|uniref:Urease accessory protein UreH-like transmembrane domain-containing protein n=1 Tax=Reichenbachiella agariperforans TaxID=156994 RepID=A0A1M6JAT5_REIAG|nr:sulfite exporter TauE/SafE family protein [Reichenbachiella agariperforans]SHJ43808.1 hypothetical protein SAMN04488028_101115 [Reichenbachiella agariperforans]